MNLALSAALSALLLATTMPGAAAAPVPRCLGKAATIVGTDRDDQLRGTDGPDVIVGLDGTDRIDGRGGNDRICAGRGGGYPKRASDLEWEVVSAGPGNDVVSGGPSPDQLFGEGGNDHLDLGGGGLDDTESVDNDGIGGTGDDVIVGTRGSDHFVGGRGDDRTIGRGGYDYFVGGRGSDRLAGGPGRDVVSYDLARAGIVADLRRGKVDKRADADVIASVADVSGSQHADVLKGSSEANTFYAGSGDDVLRGRGGGDCLLGENGTNELFGGPGFDYFAVSSVHDCSVYPSSGSNLSVAPTGSITVDLATGRAHRVGEESALTSIEGAYGTFEPDQLLGDDGDNELYGGPSRDEILGRDGDDFLDGGNEVDTLDGGAGNDECVNGEVTSLCE